MKKMLLLFATLLLIGVGCSKDDEQTSLLPSPKEAVDNDTLVETTFTQQAYLFCQQRGNTIRIRFDSTKNARVIECVFDNGSACPAEAFMEGTCEANTSTTPYPRIAQVGEVTTDNTPRFCDTVAKPVCGVDGRTYTNACIAAQQRVALASSDGPCIARETDATPLARLQETQTKGNNRSFSGNTGSSIDSKSVNTGENGIPSAPPQVDEYPPWIDISISLLNEDNSTKMATIEECQYDNRTYFLHLERCPDCFSILQTREGSIVCYPHNDISGSCPPGFDIEKKQQMCTEIWRKPIP